MWSAVAVLLLLPLHPPAGADATGATGADATGAVAAGA
eukprot:SAG22_NODE_363_length_11694_cov_40.815783_1_plen_37_part_10